MLTSFRIAFLPGLDGTGDLFKLFLAALPVGIITKVVSYPTDHFLGVAELARHVASDLSAFDPDVILAESFSGPIAIHLVDSLQQCPKLLVLCASFATNPRPLGLAFAQLLPLSQILRLHCPEMLLRLICFDKYTSSEAITLFRETISRVPPALLAFRLRTISRLQPPVTSIDIPCVLIRPRGDFLVPSKHADETRKYIERLEVVDLDGPHFFLQARPFESARELCLIVEKYLHGR